MTHRSIRRILLPLVAGGGAPVVVFDVDELRIFESDAGAAAAADALARLTGLLSAAAARTNGEVHVVGSDRFLVTLPASTYEEAVCFAEQRVDDVRALAIPFARLPGGRLSVTAAVVAVGTSSDVERFGVRVEDLLHDGKSTGGDSIIRER